jgi:hypothetical protein
MTVTIYHLTAALRTLAMIWQSGTEPEIEYLNHRRGGGSRKWGFRPGSCFAERQPSRNSDLVTPMDDDQLLDFMMAHPHPHQPAHGGDVKGRQTMPAFGDRACDSPKSVYRAVRLGRR